jgi:hypothetical protein
VLPSIREGTKRILDDFSLRKKFVRKSGKLNE